MNEHEKDLHAEELADLARRLEAALEVDTPEARSEKALFVAGAGARRRRSAWTAALIPATAAVAVLIVLAVVSRTALPGQTLYPVRKVLGGVGLAPSTANDVRTRIERAERLVDEAAANTVSEPARAMDLALQAKGVLDEAEELAKDVNGTREDALDAEIDALDDRADTAYDEAEDNLEERREPDDEREDDGDSSGPGSGDDSDGDDSSGSGSGGDDDSSGSGSGGGDDSSGSGSGGDDDSSGSGSGGDDDSSGSGSGGDHDDSSGKG